MRFPVIWLFGNAAIEANQKANGRDFSQPDSS
jgi:hypothetical protein